MDKVKMNALMHKMSNLTDKLKSYQEAMDRMKDCGNQYLVSEISKSIDNVMSERKDVLNAMINVNQSENEGTDLRGDYTSEYQYYQTEDNFFDDIQGVVDVTNARVESENRFLKEAEKLTKDNVKAVNDYKLATNHRFEVSFEDNIMIDPLMINHIYHVFNTRFSCGLKNGQSQLKGSLNLSVNDYIKEIAPEVKISLTKFVFDIEKNIDFRNIGNVTVKVLDEYGQEMYSICYLNCVIRDVHDNGFNYSSTNVRCWEFEVDFDDAEFLYRK